MTLAGSNNLKGLEQVNKKIIDTQYIVGIGASAGGLEAIHEFFDYVAEYNNLSFVIVQHLSPDYKSLMTELLTKHTKMKVMEAEDGMLIEKNQVYVIPNRKNLIVEGGKLKLIEKQASNSPNTAIDIFLESLAKEKRDKAIAVILSGTGSDGSRGIATIHKNGGLVIVQDPLTAKFDGMPNSAISTGLVDLILPPELMYDEIATHAAHGSSGSHQDFDTDRNQKVMEDILELVKNQTSHDFTFYKRPTIHRRIVRRMMLNNIKELPDFLEYLYANPEEVKLLCKEFLIGVTKFFRDPDAWEIIKKKVIPEIIARKHYNDSLKLWVAGCSSGEEAYTLAILVKEELLELGKDLNVKIFATDIDKEALEFASKGFYPEHAIMDVSPERVEKYFVREGKQYQVNQHIRKMVIFANHDLIKDPPFSKIDFISCRNLLIYLNPALQKKVLGSFHFSMNTGAYLFLGSSESIGEMKNFLTDVDKKWKIFKCIQASKGIGYEPMSMGYHLKNIVSPARSSKVNIQQAFSEVLSDTLLEEFNCAGVYIDENYELINAIGDFKKYIELPDKRLNLNILKMVSEDIAIPLGTAIRRAFKTNEKSSLKNVRINQNGKSRFVNMVVKPLLEDNKNFLKCVLILFNENASQVIVKKEEELDYSKKDSNNFRIKDLESELKETKENLQSAIEELETSNEELQSANEELLSANEELQSTNEELQSLNEELHTVNAEHQLKIKELIELNDDLNNYFRATDIGKVFLDRNLNIRKYTPSVTKHINLIESDIGRPITHISNNIKYDQLVTDIKSVMNDGQTLEKEIQLIDKRWFIMRIVPYIRQNKDVDGVVITFTEVTRLKEFQELVSGVLNSSVNGIMAFKSVRNSSNQIVDFEWMMINHTTGKLLGKKSDYFIGKRLLDEIPWIKEKGLFQEFTRVIETGKYMRTESFLPFDGFQGYYDISAVKMLDGFTVTFSDVTDKKASEQKLKEAYEELREAQESLQKLNSELEQHVEERTKELKLNQEVLKQSNESLKKINNDLDNFIYTASHDLRAPISNIEGLVDALDSVGLNGNGEASEIVNLMRVSVNKFKHTIKDLTEISRIQKEQLEDIEELNVRDLLNEIMADIKDEINVSGAEIKMDLKENAIRFSKRNLRSIFYNLLSNAIKYRAQDRNPIVEISTENVDGYVLYKVKDNGMGIPARHQDKIFSMFKRFHDHVEGSGVGLYIVKRIIDNEGGLIKVDSEENEGTTFSVYFKRLSD